MKPQSPLYDLSCRRMTCREVLEPLMEAVGDKYGEDVWGEYLADYEGYGHRFRATRIFEIGVRYGYTGTAMVVGALAASASETIPAVTYSGIDDESYHGGSCAVANHNFSVVFGGQSAIVQALQWNSITQSLPADLGPFDLIHVDGNHDEPHVLTDLQKSWPLLLLGGHLVLDDATIDGPIHRATMQFFDEIGDTAYEWQYWPNLRDALILWKVG